MVEGTFGEVLECWDRERKEMVAITIVRGIKKHIEAAMIEIDVLQQLGKHDKILCKFGTGLTSIVMPKSLADVKGGNLISYEGRVQDFEVEETIRVSIVSSFNLLMNAFSWLPMI